ncbi:MAG: hypothetical protein NTV51_08230 [Verrucomicrobia bacterium]|nr:hypothetical protein [Verrucomicrobiota bacterium]
MTELLIIKPSSLGDIVHARQVATSLKAQHAGLRISWVVREMFAPIVRACEACCNSARCLARSPSCAAR